MSDYKKNKELGHGFKRGLNNVTYTKISKWTGYDGFEMEQLVTYLKDIGFEIPEHDKLWFKINIWSDKQLNFFYNMVKEYFFSKNNKL